MAIQQKTMDVAKHLFNELDIDWRSDVPNEGMNRPAWSWEETNAMRILYGFAREELNMDVWQDLAGNIHMISTNHHNRNAKARMTGSHVDAVANGGRYDGPTGVIAPIVALYEAKLNDEIPNQPAVITIWRNEESPWLNQFAVGSKFATGVLSAEFLKNTKHTRYTHNTLLWHMDNNLDLQGTKLLKKIRSNDPRLINPETIEGLVETHIEQGSVLEKANKSLGIVTSIRGNVRFPDMIDFIGETGHTGTVPQGERRDAMRAMAKFMVKADAIFEQYKSKGIDIVWSYPEGGTQNGKSTTIAGHVRLRPEVRSTDSSILEHCAHNFEFVAQEIDKETGVRININQMTRQSPVEMSDVIQKELVTHAHDHDIDTMTMPSGAGHDVQVMAEVGTPAGLIFIRHGNKGASHRPDEILGRTPDDDPFMTSSDFANAIALNKSWLLGDKSPKKAMEKTFIRDLRDRGAEMIFVPN